jgi:hypothetical protein
MREKDVSLCKCQTAKLSDIFFKGDHLRLLKWAQTTLLLLANGSYWQPFSVQLIGELHMWNKAQSQAMITRLERLPAHQIILCTIALRVIYSLTLWLVPHAAQGAMILRPSKKKKKEENGTKRKRESAHAHLHLSKTDHETTTICANFAREYVKKRWGDFLCGSMYRTNGND